MYSHEILAFQALLDDASDPFVRDHQGNTIFIAATKSNNLWCLHFLFHTISTRYGDEVARDFITVTDIEGHTALDWAADNGNVNMMEYIIRQGLSPYSVDTSRRGPLYWATKGRHAPAVGFLVRLGCDPYLSDTKVSSV